MRGDLQRNLVWGMAPEVSEGCESASGSQRMVHSSARCMRTLKFSAFSQGYSGKCCLEVELYALWLLASGFRSRGGSITSKL